MHGTIGGFLLRFARDSGLHFHIGHARLTRPTKQRRTPLGPENLDGILMQRLCCVQDSSELDVAANRIEPRIDDVHSGQRG